MNRLNKKQLGAIQQVATNASTVVLGTFILGGFLGPRGFNLTFFLAGSMVYIWLVWLIIEINRERK